MYLLYVLRESIYTQLADSNFNSSLFLSTVYPVVAPRFTTLTPWITYLTPDCLCHWTACFCNHSAQHIHTHVDACIHFLLQSHSFHLSHIWIVLLCQYFPCYIANTANTLAVQHSITSHLNPSAYFTNDSTPVEWVLGLM